MIKTKNILIISAADPYRSAGIVALDLLNGLSTFEGNQVKLITKFCKPQNQNVISFLKPIEHNFERIINKFKKLLIKLKLKENKIKYTNPDYHVLDFDQTKTFYQTEQILKKVAFQPTHIVILFTQNFISYKNIYELNKTTGAPIYLYPMDMSLFTGACHYAWECLGYTNQCGNCPALFSKLGQDQSFINLKYKLNYIKNTNSYLFAGNNQMANQIEDSNLFKNRTIVKGIFPVPDKNIFKPQKKNEIREYFNINKTEIVLFFGSVSLKDSRKGMQILIKSLKIFENEIKIHNINSDNITLLIAGDNLNEEIKETKFKIKYLGFITDFKILSRAYSCADYFICPSIEDSGPTMILQSILCGTPTISFNIGFAKDLIINEKNGFIALQKNEHSLSTSLFNAVTLSESGYIELKANLSEVSNKIDTKVVLNNIQNQFNKW